MITINCCVCGKEYQIGSNELNRLWCSVGCQYGEDETQKHRKGGCVIFLESGMPCEDCDLEGHSAMCGWHKDWHNCDCGAFDKEE